MPYAILTRDLDGSGYAAALAPLGLEAVAMPVMRTAPPRDPGALARALAVGGHAAIVVTSPRGAVALAAARREVSCGLRLPEVWAVGPQTKRALEAEGIAAVHPEGVSDGTGLARAMLATRSLAGRRVLLARAEDGREEAMTILRAAGVDTELVAAYRSEPVPPDDPAIAHGISLLVAGEAAVCAVFAPSQVRALAALVAPALGALRAVEAVFAAIGETTASALREAGVATVAVASTPTPEGLAKAIGAVYPPR